MTKKTKRQSRTKRSNFITPRASGYVHRPRDYWPKTTLSPIRRHVVKSYMPPAFLINHAPRATLKRNPRRLRREIPAVSGMHDTPFKRPSISPYDAWRKGLAFDLPRTVKVCVQRKQRREAVFATTGGGSIRRKSTNRRTLRSQIGCK